MDASAWLGGPEPLPDFCALCHAAQPDRDLGLSVRPAYTAHGLIGFRWSPAPWHFEGSAQVPRREAVTNCANCQEWRDEIESGRHVPQEGALLPFDWHDVLQHVCSACQGATLEEGGAFGLTAAAWEALGGESTWTAPGGALDVVEPAQTAAPGGGLDV